MECKFILIVNAQAFSSWITFFGQMIISLFCVKTNLLFLCELHSASNHLLHSDFDRKRCILCSLSFVLQFLKIYSYVHITIHYTKLFFPPLIKSLRIPKSNLDIETYNNICNVRLPNLIHYVIMSSAVHLVFLSFESVRKA